ncbi:hypothetical protein CK203_021302 [Vitis vinifera]|uniref:Uncharacterized protein n=1 Tax=Vitis vinifera TaxID=29760 RepID=A0A438IM91_VITVI|nr:hypothetical protein CK203_021302 [Vitis vinifera]
MPEWKLCPDRKSEEADLETHPQVQAGTMEASGRAHQISIFLSIIELVF